MVRTGWGLFYSATLVAVPLVFVISLARRRRWGMKTLLMLPVIASGVLAGLFVGNDESGLIGRLVTGLFTAPVLFAIWLAGRWVWQRRWLGRVSKFITIVFW